MNTFTTITNVLYFHALQEDAKTGETDWSINKNAKPGDRVLLYVCAPISAIVATAYISDAPYLDEDINSMWFNTWFAEMEELKMLGIKITRHELREIFPDWGYWKQPRNSVLVEQKYLPKLDDVIKSRF